MNIKPTPAEKAFAAKLLLISDLYINGVIDMLDLSEASQAVEREVERTPHACAFIVSKLAEQGFAATA